MLDAGLPRPQLTVMVAGLRVLRFMHGDLVRTPGRVAEAIRATLFTRS